MKSGDNHNAPGFQRKRNTPAWFILAVPAVLVCLFLMVESRYFYGWFTHDPHYHELEQDKIRPMLERIAGRQLPGNMQGLRAIAKNYSGSAVIDVSFQTDQDGLSYVLDEFGGHGILMQEFPSEKTLPLKSSVIFEDACQRQEELGVALFDKELIARVWQDELEQANTGSFPKDAVAGWHLQRGTDTSSSHYRILVFKERGLVYICADKTEPGSYQR